MWQVILTAEALKMSYMGEEWAGIFQHPQSPKQVPYPRSCVWALGNFQACGLFPKIILYPRRMDAMSCASLLSLPAGMFRLLELKNVFNISDLEKQAAFSLVCMCFEQQLCGK